MNAKIAITGLPKTGKTLLALSLSNLTGIPYVQNKTMYEWYRLFNLTYNVGLDWNDLFLIAVSSFLERVDTESHYEQFISDGASFSELLWLKMNIEKQAGNGLQRERNQMEESLERISAAYAARRYDFVVHTKHPVHDASSDDIYIQLFRKYNISYKIYDTAQIEKTLQAITRDMELPVISTVKRSIFKAKRMIFKKEMKPFKLRL